MKPVDILQWDEYLRKIVPQEFDDNFDRRSRGRETSTVTGGIPRDEIINKGGDCIFYYVPG